MRPMERSDSSAPAQRSRGRLDSHVRIGKVCAVRQHLSRLEDEPEVGVDIPFPAQGSSSPPFAPLRAAGNARYTRPGHTCSLPRREGEVEPLRRVHRRLVARHVQHGFVVRRCRSLTRDGGHDGNVRVISGMHRLRGESD